MEYKSWLDEKVMLYKSTLQEEKAREIWMSENEIYEQMTDKQEEEFRIQWNEIVKTIEELTPFRKARKKMRREFEKRIEHTAYKQMSELIDRGETLTIELRIKLLKETYQKAEAKL